MRENTRSNKEKSKEQTEKIEVEKLEQLGAKLNQSLVLNRGPLYCHPLRKFSVFSGKYVLAMKTNVLLAYIKIASFGVF